MKGRSMGTKNSNTVGELRFQDYSSGEVHIHDDSHKLKFIGNKGDFKHDVNEAMKELKTDDGIVKIKGTSNEVVYLCRDGNDFHVFVAGKTDKKKELEKFVNGL